MKRDNRLRTQPQIKKTPFGEMLENARKNLIVQNAPKSVTVPSSVVPNQTEKLAAAVSPQNSKTPPVPIKQNAAPLANSNHFREVMKRRFRAIPRLERPLRIQLGIDLGTSYSKVVWRLREESKPLCFGQNKLNIKDYLLPSIVVFDGKTLCKSLEIEPEKNSAFSIPNFKICLACENESEKICGIDKCSLSNWRRSFFQPDVIGHEVAFVTAFFLAKLISRSKQLIVNQLEQEGIRQPFTVKWSATLSVPDKYAIRDEDLQKSPVANAFSETFKIAWLMAEVFIEQPNIETKEDCFALFLAADELLKDLKTEEQKFDCFVYSEIGAEIASITLSRTSEEGLYAFVDVGAGTVDASVFRFFRDEGEAKRPPYAANVFKIGAANIEVRANQQFLGNSVSWLKAVKENYRKLEKSERGGLLKPIVELLKEASRSIEKETENSLITVFREAFSKECNENKWQDLKLILGGGGAALKAYQSAAENAFTLKDTGKKPDKIDLPVPPDFQLQGLPPTEFHRFAVAYGLSHDIINLPEIVSPSEVAPTARLAKHNARNEGWYEK